MQRTPPYSADAPPAPKSLTPEQREELRSRGFSETAIDALEREHEETRAFVRDTLAMLHIPLSPKGDA